MMQLEQQFPTTQATSQYSPLVERSVTPQATDARIEDFLDHFCAPMLGMLSYEQRQSVRDMKRQEIQSAVLARMELGCTREQAIAETLAGLTVAPVTPVQQKIVPQVQTQNNAFAQAWQTTQKTAFALAAGSALVGIPFGLMVSLNFFHYFSIWNVMMLAAVAIPMVAGTVLGLNSPYRAGKGWRQAVLKTSPLMFAAYAVSIQPVFRDPFFVPSLLLVTLIHAAASSVSGSIGAWVGSKIRSVVRMACC